MSVLGLMENTADIAQTTPDLSALPSTNTERMGAAWDAAQTGDRFWNVDNARAKHADKIIDDLHAMTGERLLNPYGIGNTPTADEVRENVGQPMSVIYAKRLEKLRVATRNAKAGIEQLGGLPDDYLDVDSIDAKIASQSGAARARDERMSGTGGWAGGFIGAMAGETASPAGFATLFIPVTGGIGTTVARATIGAFAKNVAKEALFQGGTQAAAQSLQTIVDYQTRKQFGTEQTNQQIFDEILAAAGGGAVLGGGFRAVHLGILKLASRGVEIPPAVLDSARMMEEGDLYGNKNPLRINPGQMEVATDQATSAAAMGRAASPDVDVNPTQTLHEAARRLEPELMRRYDAAVAARDQARAELAPDAETIAKLKERADAADAAIAAAGPQTREAAERLGQEARMAHEIHDDAVARAEAQGVGAPIETARSESVRQQLQAADVELRDLIPEINKVMKQAGEEVTAATRAAEAARAEPTAEAGISEARLTPEEVSRVRELQDQIPEYERMRDQAATPEDKASWQQAIDDFHAEIAKIMDLDVANQAPVKAAMAKLDGAPDNPMQAPRPAPPEPSPRPAEPKPSGESPQDKAVLQQAKQVLDSETLTKIDPAAASKMAAIDMEMQQAKAAVSCLAGAL